MGYCLDRVSIHGLVHEVKANGVAVSWRVFIHGSSITGCYKKHVGDSLTVRNPIGSEFRNFRFSDTVNCSKECDISTATKSCGSHAASTFTVSEQGSGPLPDKYRQLYENLEYDSTMINGIQWKPPTVPDGYKETDPKILKSAIILSLIPISSEVATMLASSNRCSKASKTCQLCPVDLEL